MLLFTLYPWFSDDCIFIAFSHNIRYDTPHTINYTINSHAYIMYKLYTLYSTVSAHVHFWARNHG